ASYTPLTLGTVFFGWGDLLAICSLALPEPMIEHFGLVPAILTTLAAMGAMMTVLALNTNNLTVVVIGIIALGGFQGIANNLFTQSALNDTVLSLKFALSSHLGFLYL